MASRSSTLEYAGPSTPRRRRLSNWPTWLTVVALLMVLGLLVMNSPCVSNRRVHYPRLSCHSNMRQIGLAIMMYTSDNGGHLPDTLNRVLETQDITSETFVCAGSRDDRAGGATTQALAADLTAGGHLSYVYVGQGLRAPAADPSLGPDVVILFEPVANHKGEGMNVLFGDGHVEWVTGPAVRRITDQANAGIRPVIWPPRRAAAPATTQAAAQAAARETAREAAGQAR